MVHGSYYNHNTGHIKTDIGYRYLACEQGLLFGRVKRSEVKRSEARTREQAAKPRGAHLARSREAHFACPNRRACSQVKRYPPDKSLFCFVFFYVCLFLFCFVLDFCTLSFSISCAENQEIKYALN